MIDSLLASLGSTGNGLLSLLGGAGPAQLPPWLQQGSGPGSVPFAGAGGLNPMQQQAPPAPAGPGIGDRLMAGFQGFVNSGGPLPALGNLVSGLASGQRSDPAGVAQANQRATAQSLIAAGVPPHLVMGAMSNPKVLEAILPLVVRKKDAVNVNGNFGSFDPYAPAGTGHTMQGAVPQFQTVPEGASAGFPTPPAPTMFGQPQQRPLPTPSVAPGQSAPITPRPVPTSSIPGIVPGNPSLGRVGEIRKEITALPEVKRYSEALPVFRSMMSSHKLDTAAADLDFVYGVAKIFDPDSVVREGEMKLVGQAQSIPEDVKGFIKRAAFGEGRLTPEARARILEVARIRMGELDGSLKERLKPYAGTADRNGINQADIMPQFPSLPPSPNAPSQVVDDRFSPVLNTGTGRSAGNNLKVIQEAREAIRTGRDPAAVRQRLKSMGINPSELD